MAYSKQIYIEPITLTDLTVNIIHNSLIIRTSTLNDFTINNDDLLEGHITYLDNNDTVEISSTGYETQIMLASEISSTIELEPINYFSKVSDGTNIYYCKDDYARNNKLDISSFNSAMKNKEDAFDQVLSPLAITYTNGLIDFNGSDCYVTSDGILTGDTEWCTANVSNVGIDIVNDYWEFTGEFIYNNVTADESVTSVNAGNAGFVISISSSGNVYNEDDPNVVLANIAADTWTTFRYVHQAGASTVEVTFLNSQGVLETHSTLLHSDITGTLTDFNWRVNTGYGIEFNLASPVCYFMTMPNGEHQTFLSRNLEVDSTAFDGQWVSTPQVIISTPVSLNGSTDLPYTVDLPNDGHVYEVMIRADGNTGSTSGNWFLVGVRSNVLVDYAYICGTRTRTASSVGSQGTVIIPMKYGTNNLYLRRNTGYNGSTLLVSLAYRRLGTNI